jgi:Zn-dependent protease with chaperone function
MSAQTLGALHFDALTTATLLVAVAVASLWGAHVLLRAAWPRRAPATAILLWQALGLAGGVCSVGALLTIGVSMPHTATLSALTARLSDGRITDPRIPLLLNGVRLVALAAGAALLALLCWVLVLATAVVIRARRRQRELLALLAHGDPKVPGALVVDHPGAAAYCLPGLRSKIVVSVGTIDLLCPAELAAVMAHERAHLRERHDLVLLPFTSLRRAFPRSRLILGALGSVGLLIEMLADDSARRSRPARELATALLRFGSVGAAGCAPAGALAVTAGDITARVDRLLSPPPPLPRYSRAAICLAALALAATPVLLLTIP